MAKGVEGNRVRTITCAGCRRVVTRRMRPGTRFCSVECYRRSPRPERKRGTDKTCGWCGRRFYAQASWRGARFCCKACSEAHQARNKTDHICKVCGAAFRWSPSRTASGRHNPTYCSLPCRDADLERRARLVAMNAASQRGRVTRAEADGYALLDRLGVAYLRQEPFNGKFIPDATIPAARLVVQFDGDYWHDRKGHSVEPRIRRRVALDRSQDAYMRACGWRVLRLWETDLRKDPEGCAALVSRHLTLPPLAPRARTRAVPR